MWENMTVWGGDPQAQNWCNKTLTYIHFILHNISLVFFNDLVKYLVFLDPFLKYFSKSQHSLVK